MNHPTEIWKNDFGNKYFDRNPVSVDALNELYMKNFGINRTDLNEEIIGSLDRSIKILEVGCGTGVQLMALQSMGFHNLYGVEVNRYAIESSKEYLKDIDIVYGDVKDIPFKDGFFDLVFTSGLLIHIPTVDMSQCLNEICRCSNRYIWGYEYYADDHQHIDYRGQHDFLWKGNFLQFYLDSVENLTIAKSKKIAYEDGDNTDIMFLLEKG
jgi:pseudaminic acid biosynthesis-associated methylase